MSKVPKEEALEVSLVQGVHEVDGEPAVIINGLPQPCGGSGTEALRKSNGGRKKGKEREEGLGKWVMGRKVQKKFGNQMYSGVVRRFNSVSKWYRVEYEDGDSEDMEWAELEHLLLPLDINLPLRALALKMLRKSQQHLLHSNDGRRRPRNGRGRPRKLRPFPKSY